MRETTWPPMRYPPKDDDALQALLSELTSVA
jgi:hypothetical protein